MQTSHKVRGTRDILDTRLFSSVVGTIKKVLTQYNFQEIILPSLEHLSLFKRSLGLETDVVSKEMFVVHSSSSQEKEDAICLRPEATASTVRAFIENGIQATPWKVFTCGPMFRYERPQKGRFREFYQCSLEVIGSASVMQDVHLITLLDRLFSTHFNLCEYALHINFLGCPQDRSAYTAVLKGWLSDHEAQICQLCKKRSETNSLRIFDCKQETCQELYKQAPRLEDSLCAVCAKEWTTVQEGLLHLSVSYVRNPTLVRGLDYYNKTVFEFVSPLLGAQSTFCAGGRYDQLVSLLGGKPDQPSVGAAIGIDRLLLLLECAKKEPLTQEQPLYAIIPCSEQQEVLALLLADHLYAKNYSVEVLFDGSLKTMMKRADKMGAKKVLILGDQEMHDGTVKVKDMVTGHEVVIKQTQVAQAL